MYTKICLHYKLETFWRSWLIFLQTFHRKNRLLKSKNKKLSPKTNQCEKQINEGFFFLFFFFFNTEIWHEPTLKIKIILSRVNTNGLVIIFVVQMQHNLVFFLQGPYYSIIFYNYGHCVGGI